MKKCSFYRNCFYLWGYESQEGIKREETKKKEKLSFRIYNILYPASDLKFLVKKQKLTKRNINTKEKGKKTLTCIQNEEGKAHFKNTDP